MRRPPVSVRVLAQLALAISLLLANRAAHAQDEIFHRWNEVALKQVRDTLMGPPMVARMFAILHTAMFDAWAAYDAQARATLQGDGWRRPAAEHTLENKRRAISYAAREVLVDLFPQYWREIHASMRAIGYDPGDNSGNTATATGIGNVAARTILRDRRYDGANQRGTWLDEPYFDNTRYRPVNTTTRVIDPNRWQPLRVDVPYKDFYEQGFLAPHWGNVRPFALRSRDQFMPEPPAQFGTETFTAQVHEIVELSAQLTDRHKAIAEYWSAGVASESPPGHWMVLARFVSARDRHTLDRDVQMYFALSNALLDASIAAWHAKREFDYVRPITAVRHLFGDKTIRVWAGPGKGAQEIRARDWLPYQESTFVTPPFPEYISGHSTFSAAAAAVLRGFTGSDRFGASTTVPARSSLIEPGVVPGADVVLTWATFTEAADEAGLSRRYGGIHFRQGDLEGRRIGRLVGEQAWEKARTHFAAR